MPEHPTIRRCVIVDTETSDRQDGDERAELIELALVLYSVTNQTTLMEFSTLVPCLHGNRAESVNRIKMAALREVSAIEASMEAARDADPDNTSLDVTSAVVCHMLRSADALVSYNVEFDARFFRPGHYVGPPASIDWPWLCAMSDFKWPRANRQQGSLINLALDHGIGVASAHRALTDCRLLAELFDHADNLAAMFDIALRPKAMFQGLQAFADNQLAKDAGFKWERENAPRKSWTRIMAIEDAAALPFQTKKLYNVSHRASDWGNFSQRASDTLFS